MIEYQAPGKAVIWGEYAVLAGAPAMVMAVNRFARCRIERGGSSWHCLAQGFSDECSVLHTQLLDAEAGLAGAAAPLGAAARALGLHQLPKGAEVQLDTRTFYSSSYPDRKLGIGSSAAICTAACGALAELTGSTLEFTTALQAHRLLQRAEGSGIDVAAAFHGGMLRFEAGNASAAAWPDSLQHQFVWTGISAKTTSHLRSFSDWRARGDTRVLSELAESCHELFAQISLDNLTEYVRRLKKLDQQAALGIYTKPHRMLDRLAIEQQVVYKPCGAGGGDIGIAFAEEKNALNAFAEAAARLAFHPLSLEIAAYGLKPTR